MTLLTKEQILSAQDLPTEIVSVPEWGGEVIVRGLTGIERDALEAEVVEVKGKKVTPKLDNLRAKLVAMSIVDEEGKRFFSDKEAAALGRKSASALERVFKVAQRLSGLTDEDVKELEENLEEAQGKDSSSD